MTPTEMAIAGGHQDTVADPGFEKGGFQKAILAHCN